MRFFLLVLSLLLLWPNGVSATYDPRSEPNNKYGIHVADTNDILEAKELVNSAGGDWGYVTLVMHDNDQDPGKWQGIFNAMRRLHLIPIVRLATHSRDDYWLKPTPESAITWAAFLSSLNWPVENRYVVIFNEPNHAKEWGNTIDPEGYAQLLATFASTLKAASPDFFILPAGLDVSASNTADTLNASLYLNRMLAAQPGILTLLDGWTSHSYPNPGFSGSPYASGRGTVRSYQWELEYLKKFNPNINLPVFITETGWIHAQGVSLDPRLASSQQVAENLRILSDTVWTDPKIVAVTPFVFSYQGLPFDHFSWKMLSSGAYYPHYYSYKSISKAAGRPRQHERFEVQNTIPESLISDSEYELRFTVKNSGQSILSDSEGYTPILMSDPAGFSVQFDPLPILEPGQSGDIGIHIKTPPIPGVYKVKFNLNKQGQTIPLFNTPLTLIPPPSLRIRAVLGWKKHSSSESVKVILYDRETLLQEFTGVTMRNGEIRIPSVTHVVPDSQYRIVVLVPYYLPRQAVVKITRGVTHMTMKRFLPLDFNQDGALGVSDIKSLLTLPPNRFMQLLFGG